MRHSCARPTVGLVLGKNDDVGVGEGTSAGTGATHGPDLALLDKPHDNSLGGDLAAIGDVRRSSKRNAHCQDGDYEQSDKIPQHVGSTR